MSPTGTARRGRAYSALVISGTELRRWLQDRVAIFTIAIMPIAMIAIIGSLVGGGPSTFGVAVVDEDGTAASERLVEAMEQADGIAVTVYEDVDVQRQDLRLGEASLGLVIPEGYEADVQAGQTVQLPMVTVADNAAGSAITAVNGVITQQGAVIAATGFVVDSTGATPEQAVSAVSDAATDVAVPAVESEDVGVVRPAEENQFTHAAMGMLTVFMFLNGAVAGAGLVQTRKLGIGRRALSTPVGAGAFVVGQGGARFLLGLVQAMLLLAFAAMAFGVSWGDPLGILALSVAWALVSAGAGMLVGSVARTEDQAVAVAVPVSIGLGMLGGTMWPLDIVGPTMQTIGHAAPHAWAMDAWYALVNDGAGIVGIGAELAVLLGFALLLAVVSALLLRRTLTH